MLGLSSTPSDEAGKKTLQNEILREVLNPAQPKTTVALALARRVSRMRESRTYGSVRGARDEIRVPTATGWRIRTGKTGHKRRDVKRFNCARDICNLRSGKPFSGLK
jgi:hypothetical protein